MNSKEVGSVSEALVLAEFLKYDVPVCVPWGDNYRYDLVAEFNGKLNRIQVKTANEERNGSIVCYARSSTNHTTNKKLTTYEGEVDYFVFVNQTYGLMALVPMEEVGSQKTINLRIKVPENGVKNFRSFNDFSFDKIIQKVNP